MSQGSMVTASTMSSCRPTSLQIHLDTRDCSHKEDPTYQNGCHWSWPAISAPPNHSLRLALSSLSINISWLLVNSRNDTLVLTAGSTVSSLTLTHGNYTAPELRTMISSLLPANYSLTYNDFQNTFTVSYSSFSAIVLQISGTSLTMLGFTGSKASSSMSNPSLTSDSQADLTGVNSLYITTDKASFNVDSRSPGSSHILGRLSIPENFQATIAFNDPLATMGTPLYDNTLSDITIWLTDESRLSLQPLIHWQISLEVTFVPRM